MLDKHSKDRDILTQKVAGILAVFAFPYIFLFWNLGLKLQAFADIAIVGILTSAIFLNRSGFSLVSKFLVILCVDLGLLFYSSSLGKESGIYLVFFALISIPLVIFKPSQIKSVAFGFLLPIGSLFYLETTNYYLFKRVILNPSYLYLLSLTMIFVTFSIIVLTTYFYYRANTKAEQKLAESNRSLEEKNRNLVQKNNENQVLVESLGEMVKSLQRNEQEKQKLIEDLEGKNAELEKANEGLRQKAKTDKDIQAAAVVQKLIIPQEIPAPKEFEISYVYEAAKGLSGDFLDVVAVSDTKTVFVIGDITGKGIQASLKMAAAYPLFRTLIDQFTDLESLVRECNAAIYRFSELTQFIPCIFGVLDSEKMTFEFCNAGHSPGFIFSGLNVKELSSTGSPLGMEETSTYQVETIQLKKSDRIVLYTDGCTDIKNTQGERFSEKALVALLLEINAIHSETFTESVLCHLLAYKQLADLADDLTLMSIFVLEDEVPITSG